MPYERRERESRHTTSETAGEGLNGGFASGIDRVVMDTGCLGRDTGDEDQAAGVGKVFVSLLGDEELAAGIDVEDAVEIGGGDFVDGAKVLQTSTTHSQIRWLYRARARVRDIPEFDMTILS